MRIWVIVVLAFSMIGLGHAKAEPPPRPAASPLLARETYQFPFEDRADWLAFIAEGDGGVSAAEPYARLFSSSDYARYRAGTITRTTRFSYQNDGNTVRGIMVEPVSSGRHPVIIFNHGGVMQWGRIILAEILEFNRLAERGYIVMASSYRGEGGSTGEPDMDGGDVADSLALIDIAEGMPNADPQRIGMWGFSRGGLVTYGALKRTGKLAAAVIIGGPTDLVTAPRRAEFDEFVYPHVIHNYALDKDAALKRLSPLTWVDKLAARTPILLLHGGDDPRVAPSDSLRMASALQTQKHSYRLKIYEGGSHDLSESGLDVRSEIDRWFDLYLRDRRPAPGNGVTVIK